ncbi:MAG: hypothetical protein IJL54_06195 [Prevotella sp.]|nr:hypothetical protein [Prevotella sp.]
MKQLTQTQSIIFLLGGVLMVIGIGCFVFLWQQKIVCWIFLLGAVMFSLIQMMQTYDGPSLVIHRLKRIQTLADILFILAGILMCDTAYHFLLPLFRYGNETGYYHYINYVYNKWVMILLIAALLEVYSTHRIASELKK